MQIKQVRSIIQANYFTPWSEDTDLQDLLSPPFKDSLHLRQFKKHIDASPKRDIEQEAKRTLLSIDHELRSNNLADLKAALRKQKATESVFPQGLSQLKLPPINGLVDFSNCCILDNDLQRSNLSSIDDSFRKLGDFRGRGKPAALGRNLSDVSPLSDERLNLAKLRKKFETIGVVHGGSSREKSLRLKGKKFSLDSRRGEEKQEIDKSSYIPTRPNITPHHLLLGHTQDDVLKKVLHQLNYKVS